MWYNKDMIGKRVIAFDIGNKRIGVAVSDPFNEYAMPCETFTRTRDIGADAGALAKLAKEKGIILDTGNAGRVHTNFAVLRDAIAKGYLPDTISSDLTCLSAFNRGGKYGLTLCMSMQRTAGMTEEQVLRAVTSDAAKAVGMDAECGTLEVGRKADIAVLGYEKDPFRFEDTDGNVLEDENGYVCYLTVSNGQILYRR